MINLITNERLAAWSFSSLDSADPEAEITCLSLVSGVSGDPRSNNPTHVILGLDTGLHGALAVFDITEGRVVRTLVLLQRVASLAILRRVLSADCRATSMVLSCTSTAWWLWGSWRGKSSS